jgi:hypothetical protein
VYNPVASGEPVLSGREEGIEPVELTLETTARGGWTVLTWNLSVSESENQPIEVGLTSPTMGDWAPAPQTAAEGRVGCAC